ncbi:MAG: histidine phosphatase family protein, partial [Candidatus Berkelbacteria bacterium]|nr:histidine phosphatase family protein [Candidatus Berkelbacteria bacterium]
LAELKRGHNVIVSAHGNSLRAIIKHLENIPDHEICNHEIGTGVVYIYEFDKKGQVVGKEIRDHNTK